MSGKKLIPPKTGTSNAVMDSPATNSQASTDSWVISPRKFEPGGPKDLSNTTPSTSGVSKPEHRAAKVLKCQPLWQTSPPHLYQPRPRPRPTKSLFGIMPEANGLGVEPQKPQEPQEPQDHSEHNEHSDHQTLHEQIEYCEVDNYNQSDYYDEEDDHDEQDESLGNAKIHEQHKSDERSDVVLKPLKHLMEGTTSDDDDDTDQQESERPRAGSSHAEGKPKKPIEPVTADDIMLLGKPFVINGFHLKCPYKFKSSGDCRRPLGIRQTQDEDIRPPYAPTTYKGFRMPRKCEPPFEKDESRDYNNMQGYYDYYNRPLRRRRNTQVDTDYRTDRYYYSPFHMDKSCTNGGVSNMVRSFHNESNFQLSDDSSSSSDGSEYFPQPRQYEAPERPRPQLRVSPLLAKALAAELVRFRRRRLREMHHQMVVQFNHQLEMSQHYRKICESRRDQIGVNKFALVALNTLRDLEYLKAAKKITRRIPRFSYSWLTLRGLPTNVDVKPSELQVVLRLLTRTPPSGTRVKRTKTRVRSESDPNGQYGEYGEEHDEEEEEYEDGVDVDWSGVFLEERVRPDIICLAVMFHPAPESFVGTNRRTLERCMRTGIPVEHMFPDEVSEDKTELKPDVNLRQYDLAVSAGMRPLIRTLQTTGRLVIHFSRPFSFQLDPKVLEDSQAYKEVQLYFFIRDHDTGKFSVSVGRILVDFSRVATCSSYSTPMSLEVPNSKVSAVVDVRVREPVLDKNEQLINYQLMFLS